MEKHFAAGGVIEPQQRAPDGRFATAALADQAHHFLLAQFKAEAIDRLDRADLPLQQTLKQGEVHLEVIDFEDNVAFHRSAVAFCFGLARAT